ncbi:MAG: ThiF family adenylyltransferase, partial [Lachnospiraceae bacterium]|nr:ThiF family adenylyltransferase [Lachnospiraceae bacterium]
MKIYISATLRGFFGRNPAIEVPGQTVRDILEELLKEYPDAAQILYDEEKRLRPFIRIYVNGADKTDEEAWQEALPETAEVLLLPAIAGGAPTESLIPDERRKQVAFDDAEIERFSKHLMLREIGVKGQKRIKAARVLVAGAGALGSPVIQYLAAAGVGTIKVVDFDEVSLENLQSQVLHTSRDIKRPKVASARDKVRNINKSIQFEAENSKLEAENVQSMIEGYDLVVD